MRFLQLKFLLPLVAVVVLLLAAPFIMAPRFCARSIVFENPDGSIDVVARLWGSDHPCAWAYFGPREITVKVPGVESIDPLAPIPKVPEDISQRPRSPQISELGLVSIEALQSRADFTIKLPEALPRGFTLKGAYESIPFQKYEDHTIHEITLIYWNEVLSDDPAHDRDNAALFINILHAPGASVDDFGPPPPPIAIGDAPEPLPPPVAPKVSTISGNPAIIGPHSVEIFVISEETIYKINSDRYTSEQLITILESIIRG